MSRREELLNVVGDDIALVQLVDEMIFLESQIDEIKKLPFIKIHPTDKTKQKSTPAAKQYKELLQQYVNIVRLLIRATGIDETEEESPLRRWVNERFNQK